ncbi:MAG: glycosyltransferase family 2 protein [Nanoarchaeota archaeon]|nr:glycosyltransferase family 2 protein [Nanoarchaeota archaeon]
MENKKFQNRTLQDKLISGFNDFRFAVIEPILLKYYRFKYEYNYKKENAEPLISVYVPTYNRGKLLMERAVASVLAQTYKNFELIIVGDHCTDNTEELISKINDPRMSFYNIPKRERRYPPTVENHWLAGPVVAANTALTMTRGKWIARIDDDDIWTEDHLESLLRFAQKNNFEFVSALYEEERYGKRKIEDGERANGPYYNFKAKKNDNSPKIGGTQTWLYRSYLRFIKYNINCWRKSWNRVNDIDLGQRIYKAGTRIGFLNKAVAYVLPRPKEQTVGLEAYRLDIKGKEEHFKFD